MPYRNQQDAERRRAYQREYSLRRYHAGLSWSKLNPEKIRAKRRQRTVQAYGLTPEQWDAMLAAQDGRCAICGVDEPGGQQWHTDHCHTTDKTRGILCKKCNNAIGQMNDSPALLRQAADYIEKHRNS